MKAAFAMKAREEIKTLVRGTLEHFVAFLEDLAGTVDHRGIHRSDPLTSAIR